LNQFAYNVSKAAANHLTRLFSTELALKDKPVRVNAIAPGPFATEMTQLQGTSRHFLRVMHRCDIG
jgi:NAD(P)-dependent dehydrogenase (short-subunit alcohol dehydrogenase family)